MANGRLLKYVKVQCSIHCWQSSDIRRTIITPQKIKFPFFSLGVELRVYDHGYTTVLHCSVGVSVVQYVCCWWTLLWAFPWSKQMDAYVKVQ